MKIFVVEHSGMYGTKNIVFASTKEKAMAAFEQMKHDAEKLEGFVLDSLEEHDTTECVIGVKFETGEETCTENGCEFYEDTEYITVRECDVI